VTTKKGEGEKRKKILGERKIRIQNPPKRGELFERGPLQAIGREKNGREEKNKKKKQNQEERSVCQERGGGKKKRLPAQGRDGIEDEGRSRKKKKQTQPINRGRGSLRLGSRKKGEEEVLFDGQNQGNGNDIKPEGGGEKQPSINGTGREGPKPSPQKTERGGLAPVAKKSYRVAAGTTTSRRKRKRGGRKHPGGKGASRFKTWRRPKQKEGSGLKKRNADGVSYSSWLATREKRGKERDFSRGKRSDWGRTRRPV